MSKLRYDQLKKALSQDLAPVYMVTGDESLLVQEACDMIRRQAVEQGYRERELYHTDAGFKWDTLANCANSLSLFASKKIIEIRIHNGKPGDAGAKAIVEYCESVSEDNLLLLVLPKIDKRSHNSKWFKQLDTSGTIVTIWPVSAQQLPRWVAQRMRDADLNAEPQAIDVLCAKVEGNLLAAVQEIEKLKLVAMGKTIDAHTMADTVTDSARYDVFSLVDKAVMADSRAATACLQGLRAEGTEPSIILWALAREIRTLATIKEAMGNGKSFDFSAKQQGVWENRKPAIRHAVQHLSLRQLHILVRKASQADKIIKGISKGDIWNLLFDMTLSLAGTEALNTKSLQLNLR